MKRWVAAALLAAGCYRSAPPPPPEPPRPAEREPEAPARPRPQWHAPPERSEIGEAIAKLEELTDEMCACTDRACADAVTQEMTRWSTEMAKDHADLKPTEEEMEAATRISERLSKCMMAAMGYGASSPPPPP